ncbi:glycosyltransferase [Pseudorhodoferax sp. LjRoot39]|uniref:glycosyltransferase n=1 Tax=Pseudorhodoferax sp. LjRoot39 TaxID=3342328 RepID=UPI003ECF969F
MSTLPRVLVLLATHNGGPWLGQQLDSLAAQRDVNLRVLVSDDCSTDGTLAALEQWCAEQPAELVSSGRRFGSAAANFFHLLSLVPDHPCDFVALADQDDVWHPDKLCRAVEAIRARGVDAISTNVVAFWPDGREQLIRKDQPPGPWNHLFESAGPGCTYVLRWTPAQLLAGEIRAKAAQLPAIGFHDWLIQAWVRSRGYSWWTDPWPSLRYRQHGGNVFGSRSGWQMWHKRWQMVRDGWYREQVLHIARFCDAQSLPCIVRLQRLSAIDRLVLALQAGHMRRVLVDRVGVALSFLAGARR